MSTALINDTSPAAAAMQIHLLRQTTPARRLEIAIRLSEETLALAHKAIAHAHPSWSERERDLLFVKVHYGNDLARRLAVFLEQNDPSDRNRQRAGTPS